MGKKKAKTNPVGRPPLYTTEKQLQKIIDEYFEWCDNRAIKIWDDKREKELMISRPAPYTMSGLARRLGMSRETLVQYSKKEQFSDAIMRARDKIHEDVENRLMETRNEKGAIFNLKNNFGWKDKTETDLTTQGEKLVGFNYLPPSQDDNNNSDSETDK